MLTHPTLDKLDALGLFGTASCGTHALRHDGFAEISASGDATALPLSEGLGLLADRETSCRHNKRLAARLRYARLRHQAAV